MVDQTVKISVEQYGQDKPVKTEVEVVREFPVTIILNNEELVTMLASPLDMNYLAAGYLASEGLIKTKKDIKKILIDEQRGIARVETTEEIALSPDFLSKRLITSSCGRGASFYSAADAASQQVESSLVVSPEEIRALANRFQHTSELYVATHGLHSAALCSNTEILAFFEDVGRHNAIDKVFGKCLLEDIPTADHVMVTSGRISSDSVAKAAKRNVPVLVSIAVPTELAVRMANDFGLTLVGRAAKEKMNVYTHTQRVTRKK